MDPPARLIVGAAGGRAGVELAVAGHGLIFTFQNWLQPHLDGGALVPVLRDWWPEFDGPRLYFSSRVTPKPLRSFIDMLAEIRAGG